MLAETLPGVDVRALARLRYIRMRDFIQTHVLETTGPRAGKPLILLPEQKAFLWGVYGQLKPDGRLIRRRAIHSCGRKNGKTAFISGILQGHLFGPEARINSQIYSAARSREQAAVVYKYAADSIRMNPRLNGLVQLSDSVKTMRGVLSGAVYRALSAEARTAHGLNPSLIVHDELGQVVGPVDPFFDALETATGSQAEPLSIIISTQAANDGDLLSILIDDALSANDPTVLVQLFAAAKDADLLDETEWKRANYALGVYRSLDEMRTSAEQARRMPSLEARFRNLYLNQRIAAGAQFMAPDVWRSCSFEAPDEWFRTYPVHIGLDLSARTDLTAAVLAVRDPESGRVGLRTFAFTPEQGLEERARADRAPYPLWVKQGHLIATPGRAVDYQWVAEFLRLNTAGMQIESIHYDRWRITLMQREADVVGFADGAEWLPVGQGYRDMSPRLEMFEVMALEGQILHGGHPVLTHAAMGSKAVQDPAGNRKLEKSKSSARIDAMVAAVMAVYGAVSVEAAEYDVSFM